jgi:hypothetical protein
MKDQAITRIESAAVPLGLYSRSLILTARVPGADIPTGARRVFRCSDEARLITSPQPARGATCIASELD